MDRARDPLLPARLEARRRDPGRHRLVPARERRVDRGRQPARRPVRRSGDEPGPDRLPARRRADRGGQAEDRRRRAGARGAARRRAAADRAAGDAVRAQRAEGARLRRRLARLHGAHRADRLRERRRLGRCDPRDHGLGSRRDEDPAHRRHRLQHRRLRGLLRHRHEAAVRDRAPGLGPARRDLPLGAGGADAADRRLPRLHRRQRVHLPAGEERRDGLLELDLDPDRAHVRRRHRLLPAAGLAIARGAAHDRGQARGDGARPAQIGARDPRQRPDRDPGDAGPGAGRLAEHGDARSGRGNRRRQRDGRRAHPAAGTADDLRAPGLLAAKRDGRLRPRARGHPAARPLAAVRRSRPAEARTGAGGHPDRLHRRRAWAARLQGRLLHHHLLQEVGRERRGLRGARSRIPARACWRR